MEVRVSQHEHPLHLRDLLMEYEIYEDEHEDEDEDIIIPQDFRSLCKRCGKEINWLHRYFYECAHSCDFVLHKFCFELPVKINHKLHSNDHTLTLNPNTTQSWRCNICGTHYYDPRENSGYECSKCDFDIDIGCAIYQIIHHPSHPHPLVRLPEPILSKCDACGEKHEGIFYLCTTCFLFIHIDCASLPKKLFIQKITNSIFSHGHPLTLSYSFPEAEQNAKLQPRCRVCGKCGYVENLWILKCDKCRYYAHLSCAISVRNSSSSFGTQTTQNFKDSDYPDLLRLPFPTVSDSILKHRFPNQVGCEKIEDENPKHYKCHPHPLILVRTDLSNDIATPSSTTTTTLSSCHDPTKKIELLCNGCLRPITGMPYYKCADKDNKCDFVLHEWCTRLPDELQDYTYHKQHTLILQTNASNKFFSVFDCAVCELSCNGFVYTCVQCDYLIDVKCAFLPEKITHEAHPGHLMSRVVVGTLSGYCRVCQIRMHNQVAFGCDTCSDVRLHAKCAMLLPREIKHKYDEHPMSISYNPIENHKSEYFCEVCEEEFDPERCFYHCYQCAQSIHTHCAPLILQSERAATSYWKFSGPGVYEFVNIKFGGMHSIKDHHHPLIFSQGIQSDGICSKCHKKLHYNMIFKCQQCSAYAIHLDCNKDLSGNLIKDLLY